MRRLRLLDFGGVSPLRSQTLYHAVCEGVSRGEPESLLLMYPKRPYVCVGYHSDIEEEINLAYCRERRLPVYRRQAGGGPVYLDRDQLFFQLILHEDSVPQSIQRTYAQLLEAPIRRYRALGLDACLENMNDICVHGRKISGTAMAKIQQAVVLVGNVIFDFDYDAMVAILNLPDAVFREQVAASLRRYLTTLKRELPVVPAPGEVKALLADQWTRLLNVEMEPAALSPYEQEKVVQWDRRVRSRVWLSRAVGRPSNPRRVKIKGGVAVAATSCRVNGTALSVVVSVADGRITNLTFSPLSGNGSTKPHFLRHLRERLLDQAVERSALERSLACCQEAGLIAGPGDVVDALVAAAALE